jgi:peptidylprolyl isomerase
MFRLTLKYVSLVSLCYLMIACSQNSETPKASVDETKSTPSTTATVSSIATPTSNVSTSGATNNSTSSTDLAGKPNKKNGTKVVTTPSGLKYEEIKVGTGTQPKKGQVIKVHYTGTLENGTKFDSSRDRGQPFEFNIGAGQVIPGWDEGLSTMKVGGRRKLIIPSKLGYGPGGTPDGTIPPNATLIFDVELLGIK